MKYIIDEKTNIEEIINKIADYDELFFKNGIYDLKLNFKANYLRIIGEDKNKTIIKHNDHYHKIMADFNECNTFRTATVTILGDNCVIDNLTILNTCDSKTYGQAVALMVCGNHFVCRNSVIKGEQDTLFTGPLPKDLQIRYKDFLDDLSLKSKESKQTYLNCQIYGDVDFIFGCGTCLFKECEIICLHDHGFLSAPSHELEQKYGYLFTDCKITTVDKNAQFYLARPWRDYGMAYFINCTYDTGILEVGFNKWNDTSRDKTCRFYEYNPKTYQRAYFVKQLNEDEAYKYLDDFLDYLYK